MMVSNELVGVLTVYSTHRDAFSEEHRRVVEVVARQVSQTVRHAAEFSHDKVENLRDQLTGLPNQQLLERFVTSEVAASGGQSCSILLVDVRTASMKSASRGSQPLIAQVADAIRAGLRGADLLFRYDTDRFVALLTQTDGATADLVARRVATELAVKGLAEDDVAGATGAVVHLGRATAPEDGRGLADLVKVAESRTLPPPPSLPRQSIH